MKDVDSCAKRVLTCLAEVRCQSKRRSQYLTSMLAATIRPCGIRRPLRNGTSGVHEVRRAIGTSHDPRH